MCWRPDVGEDGWWVARYMEGLGWLVQLLGEVERMVVALVLWS